MSYILKDSGIIVGQKIQTYLETIGTKFQEKFKKSIVITSGTRSSLSQASAMYKNFISDGGTSIQKSKYRQKTAFDEVAKAYEENRLKSQNECIAAMQKVIDTQINNGVYISDHLIDSAADIRTYDLTKEEGDELIKLIQNQSHSIKYQDKRTSPRPHIHIQLK